MSEDGEARLRAAFDQVGTEGIAKLVTAFYQQVPASPVLGPMYPPEELEAAEQRLRDFLLFRFGGDQTYLERRGHPRLRMRHAPFAIGIAARNEWVRLMDNAFGLCAFPPEAEATLKAFLFSTATFLINRNA